MWGYEEDDIRSTGVVDARVHKNSISYIQDAQFELWSVGYAIETERADVGLREDRSKAEY